MMNTWYSNFSQLHENANIFFTACKQKKIQWQNFTPMAQALWFQVQHYPFWTNLAFACKTETLSSLYSYAILN